MPNLPNLPLMKLRQLESSYYLELAALLTGAIIGHVLAWWLHGFGFTNPGELAAAREAGIVSGTILNGYPKSRDTDNYVLALLLPLVCALTLRWACRIRSPLGTTLLAEDFSCHVFSQRSYWPAMVAIALWSWHATTLIFPGWNPYVGAWPFLGEEGQTLAWLQSLSEGGVFGRDFFCIYGPMFIYPLFWLMDLVGDHAALMERYYKFLLQMIAFALLAFLLLRTLHLRLLAWSLAIGIAFAYPALMLPSANTSLLRMALALFTLGSIAFWIDTRKQCWCWVGGLVLGQSFLFSQEVAVCALGAGSVMTYLDALERSGRHASALRSTAILWGITLLSMSPMLLYLLAHGAGAAMLDSLIGYPKLVMLGFGAQPFPSMRDWLQGSFRYHWIHYAVIVIYSGSAIALVIAWTNGMRSSRLLWGIGLTLFGIVLFRQALGRSCTEQTIKVMLPAVFLSALWLDEAWLHVCAWEKSRTAGIVASVLGTLVLFNLVMGIGYDPLIRGSFMTGWRIGTTLDGKFSVDPKLMFHPRIGFALDPQTQLSVSEIGAFLVSSTVPSEPVYFFPNEAAYYFVFDRPNPTRYAISYFATPYDRQREVIRDLETRRPRFVIFSKLTWRVDNIPEGVQLPLIVDYLNKNYRPIASMKTVEILAHN